MFFKKAQETNQHSSQIFVRKEEIKGISRESFFYVHKSVILDVCNVCFNILPVSVNYFKEVISDFSHFSRLSFSTYF